MVEYIIVDLVEDDVAVLVVVTGVVEDVAVEVSRRL